MNFPEERSQAHPSSLSLCFIVLGVIRAQVHLKSFLKYHRNWYCFPSLACKPPLKGLSMKTIPYIVSQVFVFFYLSGIKMLM